MRFSRQGVYIYIFIFIYNWFALMYGRDHDNTVKQLSFNKKSSHLAHHLWQFQTKLLFQNWFIWAKRTECKVLCTLHCLKMWYQFSYKLSRKVVPQRIFFCAALHATHPTLQNETRLFSLLPYVFLTLSAWQYLGWKHHKEILEKSFFKYKFNKNISMYYILQNTLNFRRV